jgi:chemotaxis signal transduction protein
MTIRPRSPKEDLDPRTREILAQRAERLRAPPAAAVEGPVEWVAEFRVGEERYAIALSTLRSVVPLRRVTPVPLSQPHVVGILRFQSQVITALSMASLLGVRGWRQDPAVLLVVDPGWGRLVAIDCEEVPRPIGVDRVAVEQARARGAKAIIEVLHAGRIVHLVDLGRLLDRRTGARSGT